MATSYLSRVDGVRAVIRWAGIMLMLVICVVLGVAQEQPGRPTGLVAHQMPDGVAMGWRAPSGEVDGYEILRRRPNHGESDMRTLVSNTGNTDTWYTDTTATDDGVRYNYRVRAIRNGVRSEASNEAGVHRIERKTDVATEQPPAPTAIPTEQPQPKQEPTEVVEAVVVVSTVVKVVVEPPQPTEVFQLQVQDEPQAHQVKVVVVVDEEPTEVPQVSAQQQVSDDEEEHDTSSCAYSFEVGTFEDTGPFITVADLVGLPILKANISCSKRYFLTLSGISTAMSNPAGTYTVGECTIQVSDPVASSRSVNTFDGDVWSEPTKKTYYYSSCDLLQMSWLNEYDIVMPKPTLIVEASPTP